MMHASDIEDDISKGDIRGMEAAFRALVGYPNEETIVGANTADALSDLLYRVAAALESDMSIMPNGTYDILKRGYGQRTRARGDRRLRLRFDNRARAQGAFSTDSSSGSRRRADIMRGASVNVHTIAPRLFKEGRGGLVLRQKRCDLRKAVPRSAYPDAERRPALGCCRSRQVDRRPQGRPRCT